MKPQAASPFTVATPQAVTDFWTKYYATGNTSYNKKQMLASPIGQQALALTKQKAVLTDQQRASMSLPLLASSTSGGTSGGLSTYQKGVARRGGKTMSLVHGGKKGSKVKSASVKSRRIAKSKTTTIGALPAVPKLIAQKKPKQTKFAVKGKPKYLVANPKASKLNYKRT
jgi:hypothetical protein